MSKKDLTSIKEELDGKDAKDIVEAKRVNRSISIDDSLELWIARNPKQETFCRLYASEAETFGNGVASYGEAYGMNVWGDSKDYRTAVAGASRLLTNSNVLKRINMLLETDQLNDAWIDRQLAFVATQNADLGAKVSAIREYNKLKGRIDNKLKVEHSIEPKPILGGISSREDKIIEGEIVDNGVH